MLTCRPSQSPLTDRITDLSGHRSHSGGPGQGKRMTRLAPVTTAHRFPVRASTNITTSPSALESSRHVRVMPVSATPLIWAHAVIPARRRSGGLVASRSRNPVSSADGGAAVFLSSDARRHGVPCLSPKVADALNPLISTTPWNGAPCDHAPLTSWQVGVKEQRRAHWGDFSADGVRERSARDS